MDNKAVNKEKKRLQGLLERSGVPEHQQEALVPLVEELAWQRVKLEETRHAIKDSAVVIAYDNGGGQKGIRENPIYKGYIALWRAYMLGFDKFASYLPEETQAAEKGACITVLEQVRNMKKA